MFTVGCPSHVKHYSATDIGGGLHAPAFTPGSAAHDFTLRILEC